MTLVKKRLGLGQTFFGIISEPRATIEILFQHPRYPFPSTLLALLLIAIFLPFAIQIHLLRLPITRPEFIAGLACTLGFTLLLFLLLEWLLLAILGIQVSLRQLYALIAYASVPLTASLVCLYLANRLIDGDFTLVNFALTGYSRVNRQFMAFIPLIILLTHLAVIFVFAFGLEHLGRAYLPTSLCITIVSAVPFYASVLIGLYITESAIPGTYQALIDAVIPGGRWLAEQWQAFVQMI